MKNLFLYILCLGGISPAHAIYYKRFPYNYNYCYQSSNDHQRTFPYFLGEIDTGERCGYSYFSRRKTAFR